MYDKMVILHISNGTKHYVAWKSDKMVILHISNGTKTLCCVEVI